MNIGVIDIGTNSIHMLVVRVDADLRYHVIDRAKDMVRLGQGVFQTGRLDEGAQRRAIQTLTRFHRLAQRRGVERFIAVATSAVREAENGGAFLQEVYSETGIHPHIISGAEEARLIFKAVQHTLPLDERPFLVVDVGGGSVEFAVGSSRQLSWTKSLPLGVQRLEAVGMSGGAATPEGRRAMRALLDEEFAPIAKRVAAAKVESCYVTSGSAAALLKLLRARGDPGAAEGQLRAKALADLDEELALTTREKRASMPGIEGQRVDLVVPAAAFFRALIESTGVAALTVSDRALREGLVLDFIDRHGADLQWELTEPNSRRRAVLRFCERFGYDAPHAHHVSQLAVAIFDGTRDIHGLGERARELLEYGALVHDVGYAVSEKAHHKHTEYLVLNGLRAQFNETETRLIAAIGRYHRKSFPREGHENFARIDEEDQDLVEKTAAILRVADGLDRSHARAVEAVQVEVLPESVVRIRLLADGPTDLETWAARKKSDMFIEVFGHELDFETEPAPAPAPQEGAPHASD